MASNRDGTEVDPVPFVVVSGLAVLVCFSFGPIYLDHAFGLGLVTSLATAAVVSGSISAAAWYRFVWDHDPVVRAEVPAPVRLRRLYYGMLVLAGVLLLLALPLW